MRMKHIFMIIASIALSSNGAHICAKLDEYYNGLGYIALGVIIVTQSAIALVLLSEWLKLRIETDKFDNYNKNETS